MRFVSIWKQEIKHKRISKVLLRSFDCESTSRLCNSLTYLADLASNRNKQRGLNSVYLYPWTTREYKKFVYFILIMDFASHRRRLLLHLSGELINKTLVFSFNYVNWVMCCAKKTSRTVKKRKSFPTDFDLRFCLRLRMGFERLVLCEHVRVCLFLISTGLVWCFVFCFLWVKKENDKRILGRNMCTPIFYLLLFLWTRRIRFWLETVRISLPNMTALDTILD